MFPLSSRGVPLPVRSLLVALVGARPERAALREVLVPLGVVFRELQAARDLALGSRVGLEARGAHVAPALEVGAALLRLLGDARLEDRLLRGVK